MFDVLSCVNSVDYSRFVKHERQKRNSQKVTRVYDFRRKKIWLQYNLVSGRLTREYCSQETCFTGKRKKKKERKKKRKRKKKYFIKKVTTMKGKDI